MNLLKASKFNQNPPVINFNSIKINENTFGPTNVVISNRFDTTRHRDQRIGPSATTASAARSCPRHRQMARTRDGRPTLPAAESVCPRSLVRCVAAWSSLRVSRRVSVCKVCVWLSRFRRPKKQKFVKNLFALHLHWIVVR